MVKKIAAKTYVWVMLFIMYAPILLLVIYSFQNTQYINLNHFSRLSGSLYVKLFENEEIMEAVWNTILIAISSAIVSTILGTLGAIGIFYSRKKMKKTMSVLNQIPVLNAEIVTALSLTILFTVFKSLFGLNFGFFTLLVGHVVLTIPFVVLSVIPKLQQMDSNIYEAALDLGATPNYALWKVILPEILPGIFSGFLLSITLSLDDYIITAFTKSDSFTTLSTYVYGVTAKGPLPSELRALTTLIFVGILIGLLIYNFVVSKKMKTKSKRRVRV